MNVFLNQIQMVKKGVKDDTKTEDLVFHESLLFLFMVKAKQKY